MRLLPSVVGVVVLTALLVSLSDLLGGGRIPIYRDLLPFVYPYRAFLAERLSSGELPLWNPYVHLGVPFLASLHASVLYPPSALLLLPFPLGFNVFLLAQYLIGVIGFAAWLRSRALDSVAVAVGALVFAIGGYLPSALTNTAHLQAAVWIPWLLLAWDRYTIRGSRRALLATIVLLGIQFCAGAPEVWVITVGLLAARSVAYRRGGLGVPVRLVLSLIGAVVGSAMLVAVQIFPTVEYVVQSRRLEALGPQEATYWSLEPVSLLQFLLPHSTALAAAHEAGTVGSYLETVPPLVQSLYVGIFGLLLAIVGVAYARERLFWGAMGAASVLFALGPGSPLFDLLHATAPGLVARARYPEKVLVLLHVALAVLAADGAAAIVARQRDALRVSFFAASSLALAAGGVLVAAWIAPSSLTQLAAILTGRGDLPLGAFRLLATDLAYKAERASLLLGAWGALSFLRMRDRLSAELYLALVVLILAVDLASVHRNLALSVETRTLANAAPIVDVERLRRERAQVFQYQRTLHGKPVPGLVRRLPEILVLTDLRAFAVSQWRSLYLDLGMMHGVGTMSGFDTLGELPELEDAVAALPIDRAIRLLGAYGVSMLVGTEPLPDAVEPFSLDEATGLRTYGVRDAAPLAYLTSNLEAVALERDVFLRLADAKFPRRERAIVSQAPEGWVDGPPLEPEEFVRVTSRGSGETVVDVTCRHTRFLVVNERHFPGWLAERNGQAVDIHRANGLVRGVVVPLGKSRVRLHYAPRSFRIGARISAIVAAAVLLAFVSDRLR